MKARPWLARSGSESELPCQFDEDGKCYFTFKNDPFAAQ